MFVSNMALDLASEKQDLLFIFSSLLNLVDLFKQKGKKKQRLLECLFYNFLTFHKVNN